MKNVKKTIKSIYSDIREQLFKMIPENWDSIYLYASVVEGKRKSETGEMFFYYYPKSIIKKNPINVYEVPAKFNINEQEYMRLASHLYAIIKELRHMCMDIDKISWTNITISIENVEFLVEYNLDDLENSPYSADDLRNIWKYKYLDYPIERMSRKEKEVLNRYLQEEEWGQHGKIIYSETFYQKHEHTSITYNEEVTNTSIEMGKNIEESKKPKKVKELNEATNVDISNNEEKMYAKKVKNQLLKIDEFDE